MANILFYYKEKYGKRFIEEVFEKYKFSERTIQHFCQGSLENIYLIPFSAFTEKLVELLAFELKGVYNTNDIKVYYNISLLKNHYSNPKNRYYYAESNKIDISRLSYDNNDIDNINEIVRYVIRDIASEESGRTWWTHEGRFDYKSCGFSTAAFGWGGNKDIDEYTIAQIANYYMKHKKTKSLFNAIKNKKVTDKALKYILEFDKNAIIATDLITQEEKKAWIIAHAADYDYRELPDELSKDEDIIKACKEIIQIEKEKQKELDKLKTEEQVQEVLKDISRYEYDDLPSDVAKDDRVKEAFHRTRQIYELRFGRYVDSSGYKKEDWKNWSGELIEFFKIRKGNLTVEINSKNDYLMILDTFLKSNYSVERFCEKYSITPIEGFRRFLERVSEENVEIGKVITERNQAKQKNSFAMLQEVAEKFATDDIDMEDLLEGGFASTISFNKIDEYADGQFKYDAKTIKEKIAKYLGDYIVANEYKLYIKNLGKFVDAPLSKDNKREGTQYFNGFAQNVENILKRFYPGTNKEKYEMAHKAAAIVKGYAAPYDRSKLYSGIMVDGKMVEVTQDHVDQMLVYLKNNRIAKTLKTANYYLKKIVTGEIDYRVETEIAKSQAVENVSELKDELDEKTTVRQYIDYVGKKSKSVNDE